MRPPSRARRHFMSASQLNARCSADLQPLTESDVGPVGEVLLDRPGVLLMVTLWCIGVACAALPIRFKEPLRNGLPAFGVALLLAFLPPRLVGVFACTMVTTLVVMVPALWLIAADERANQRRAAVLLAASGALLGLGPLLPDGYAWLAIPFAPVLIFGIPVGFIMLAHRALRSRPWLPAVVASVAFRSAWLMWRARDHYYRMMH